MEGNLQNKEIYHDMFNYYNLITKVNPNYLLVFDKKEKCFLVLNSAKNFQICLKTYNISSNLVKLLSESRIENSKKLFEEIEENNEKILQKNISNSLDEFNQKSKEIISLKSKLNSISSHALNKIIEGKHA